MPLFGQQRSRGLCVNSAYGRITGASHPPPPTLLECPLAQKEAATMSHNINRRDFFKTTASTGAALGMAPSLAAQGRVIGSNDRINLGIIGVGARGSGLLR